VQTGDVDPRDPEQPTAARKVKHKAGLALRFIISSVWLPNALVQLQAQYNHCGEAASEKCLSAATFVRRPGAWAQPAGTRAWEAVYCSDRPCRSQLAKSRVGDRRVPRAERQQLARSRRGGPFTAMAVASSTHRCRRSSGIPAAPARSPATAPRHNLRAAPTGRRSRPRVETR
jgi:hypothetical protein